MMMCSKSARATPLWFLHPPSGQYDIGNQQWTFLAIILVYINRVNTLVKACLFAAGFHSLVYSLLIVYITYCAAGL